jgi:hypothetical protein
VRNFPLWIEARKRYRLSHGQIQMARELGMNPKKFGKLANHRQERWKLPLAQFVEELYFKRFGRPRPERVLPLEEWAQERKRKKQEKKEQREQRLEQKAQTLGAETQTSCSTGTPDGAVNRMIPPNA